MTSGTTKDQAAAGGSAGDQVFAPLSGGERTTGARTDDGKLSADVIRQICLEAGADDAGFVEVDREGLAEEREGILRAYPKTRALISIIKQSNRESIQSASLPVVDEEYRYAYDELGKASKRILKRLNAIGIRGVTTPTGFPMDMTLWPGKIWDVGHKSVAVEAGLGHMGLHRNVIHPKLGGNIHLETILIDTEMDSYDKSLDDNPCIDCKLCAVVCPVAAIPAKDGEFSFMKCVSHNYHEMIGGFQDWIEGMVGAKSVGAYRSQFKDGETLMKWQALTIGYQFRCSYCMAVCPAGEEALPAYESGRKEYLDTIVKPLKNKKEPVYVIANTDSEETAKKNPAKEVRYVNNTIRPVSVASFLVGARLAFVPERAKGLDLNLHFEFTGKENVNATIAISDGTISVQEGFEGTADLKVIADSETWVKMLNEQVSLPKALITRKLKLKGSPARMKEFKSCIA
jgi:Fe-S-cluster-containing hydrogenase component 2